MSPIELSNPQAAAAAPEVDPMYPFKNSKCLLVVIPDKIDIEEEARLYEDLCDASIQVQDYPTQVHSAPAALPDTVSVFSRDADIWLGDNSGESLAFARDVRISGWTSVGDKMSLGGAGAYVVYDCVIKTKEGTDIHAHKRYSAFEQLYTKLRRTLPPYQRPCIPQLPPKSPLARYRAPFLDRRRRLLQHWLAAVLLHPEIGGCEAVRRWVME